ncbi:MAG: excinuclease ABC subunit UvrC [Bacteroidia bacterium]|nr:excinuclease ABC subunit UvrC [Bacteroidia bacterium]MDW8347699.1 excinuclease ABC subunit UvrC [Bacteroidia bacterium]
MEKEEVILNESVIDKAKNLPLDPGCYKFYNEEGTIIYIGKAKSLRKRVSSYFNPSHTQHPKVRIMVRQIADIQYIVTETELDALILENNLIKQHQPKYNILLKDDKRFPFLCIKNEPFPRLLIVRKRINDGSLYFGPYPNSKIMYAISEILHKTMYLRTCNYHLSESNIAAKKFRPCLEYHIGRCKAPCAAQQDHEDYMQNIEYVRKILSGNTSQVLESLKNQMFEHAAKLEFEKANLIKEKYELLKNYKSKSTVVSEEISNVDVFTVISNEKLAFVNFLKVVEGTVILAKTIEVKKVLDESDTEILNRVIYEEWQKNDTEACKIITNIPVTIHETLGKRIDNLVPTDQDAENDWYKLMMLSLKNVTYTMNEQINNYEKINPEYHYKEILEVLQKDLRLSTLPKHIECFDNSNLQGTNPVSAMVVYKNARPSKKDYRRYHIRTVSGPDDFATMREVFTRRYAKAVQNAEDLPDLIIVDGGKGQLSAAVSVLESLNLDIPIIGIAKKLEEIYFKNDPIPLHIDKKSISLKFIQRIRDEVHRYAITFHRDTRSKATIQTELLKINGIGANSAKLLLQEFGSIKAIKEASLEDIAKWVGMYKAHLVKDYLDKQEL